VTLLLHALLLEIPEKVKTPRLTLGATRAGAADAIHEAVEESYADLRRWMPWAAEPQKLEDARAHCATMTAKWHAREELDFCFLRDGDGVLVGKGGLHTIDWSIPKFEIGYWVRSSCAGQGYATEAAEAMAGMARTVLGAVRLEIRSDARNHASRRVAEKCGFDLEGIARRSRRDNAGALADSCMYARVF
jgi:RimJ/RimL family protein N-acetyltransferase